MDSVSLAADIRKAIATMNDDDIRPYLWGENRLLNDQVIGTWTFAAAGDPIELRRIRENFYVNGLNLRANKLLFFINKFETKGIADICDMVVDRGGIPDPSVLRDDVDNCGVAMGLEFVKSIVDIMVRLRRCVSQSHRYHILVLTSMRR
jgi:hypothetical protein